MRDPKRIDRILKKLRAVWTLVPDWRLGQVVSNLLGPGPHDVFHVPDEEWEKILDSMLSMLETEEA